MPFKSKAQLGKFAELVKSGKMSQETFDTWIKETPSVEKLPDRIRKGNVIRKVKKL